ncbi:MAG: hypothetical protein K6U74_17410 [Firmicutes bacterium]|nr:hypothetical protein [Bacillota bacterium]
MKMSMCESCGEKPATGRSRNPDWSGYDLCDECIAEYDSWPWATQAYNALVWDLAWGRTEPYICPGCQKILDDDGRCEGCGALYILDEEGKPIELVDESKRLDG